MALIDTAESIRKLRRERGLSQEALAELARLNRVTIAKYESGLVEPGAQAISRLAEAFNVTADEVLGSTHQDKSDSYELKIYTAIRTRPPFKDLVDIAYGADDDMIDVAITVLKAMTKKRTERRAATA